MSLELKPIHGLISNLRTLFSNIRHLEHYSFRNQVLLINILLFNYHLIYFYYHYPLCTTN